VIDALLTTEDVPHTELKELGSAARFVVRTGDATPYSNVVLQAGYPFWS
jgi:D-ribose pyranase